MLNAPSGASQVFRVSSGAADKPSAEPISSGSTFSAFGTAGARHRSAAWAAKGPHIATSDDTPGARPSSSSSRLPAAYFRRQSALGDSHSNDVAQRSQCPSEIQEMLGPSVGRSASPFSSDYFGSGRIRTEEAKLSTSLPLGLGSQSLEQHMTVDISHAASAHCSADPELERIWEALARAEPLLAAERLISFVEDRWDVRRGSPEILGAAKGGKGAMLEFHAEEKGKQRASADMLGALPQAAAMTLLALSGRLPSDVLGRRNIDSQRKVAYRPSFASREHTEAATLMFDLCIVLPYQPNTPKNRGARPSISAAHFELDHLDGKFHAGADYIRAVLRNGQCAKAARSFRSLVVSARSERRALDQQASPGTRLPPRLLIDMRDAISPTPSPGANGSWPGVELDRAEALLLLGQMLRDGLLPLSAGPSTHRFGSAERLPPAVLLRRLSKLADASGEPAIRASAILASLAAKHSAPILPVGASSTSDHLNVSPTSSDLRALDVSSLNTLLHHLLRPGHDGKAAELLLRQSLARGINPDGVTTNLILRRATLRGNKRLGNAMLRMLKGYVTERSCRSTNLKERPLTSTPGFGKVIETGGAAFNAHKGGVSSAYDLSNQLVEAMRTNDSYRMVAILAHATATGRTRRPSAESLAARRSSLVPTRTTDRRSSAGSSRQHLPGAQPASIFRAIYPFLHLRPPRRLPRTVRAPKGVILTPSQRQDPPPVGAPELHPRVLSTFLNLCVKTGRVGLAERVWRLMKQTSARSRSELALAQRTGAHTFLTPNAARGLTAWHVPIEAATSIFRTYAREARIGLRLVRRPLRSSRLKAYTRLEARLGMRAATPRPMQQRGSSDRKLGSVAWPGRKGKAYGLLPLASRTTSKSRAVPDLSRSLQMRRRRRKCFPVGWGIYALRRQIPRAFMARRVAKSEYLALRQEWQLGQWTDSAPRVASSPREITTRPDGLFFDALLDIFGRRRDMRVRRAKFHASTGLFLSRRGTRGRTSDTRSAAVGPPLGEGLEDVSSIPTPAEVAEKLKDRVAESFDSASDHPMLLLVLCDMAECGVPIPLAFQHLLPLGVPSPKTDHHVGSAFRVDKRYRTLPAHDAVARRMHQQRLEKKARDGKAATIARALRKANQVTVKKDEV
ncbi:hypothetical protein IE81DRAFT_319424 [Ceraceosorus guamensis]|uniref:Uncharacterized protein n=1 Tax=Ceraceosorus guamensis TaxID=1522189 RepID=A0A316WE37_9BASI|nr:hypothetical protein IE81DRAFT_319424 [Ceraceosorus guamensis]PWN46053.1 hypothetical protein IE81DRAFT_319424 [Ceraceosorus guamensis]